MVPYSPTDSLDKCLFIVGGASTALEMREAIEATTHPYSAIYNVVANGDSCRYSFITDEQLSLRVSSCCEAYFIVGFTNVALKQKYRELFLSWRAKPANIIHPTALVSPSATLGVGNYLAAYSIVSSEAVVGNDNLINLATTIGHNAVVGNDNVFNPGTRISGNVTIGDRCLFGANSFVYQGIQVCSDCKVDAQTYLAQNLDNPSLCTSNLGFKCYKNRDCTKQG